MESSEKCLIFDDLISLPMSQDVNVVILKLLLLLLAYYFYQCQLWLAIG